MDDQKIAISRTVLDRVLGSVDAETYVELLDPVRVRDLVQDLPEPLRLWLLGDGAPNAMPELCDLPHGAPPAEAAKMRAAKEATAEQAAKAKAARVKREAKAPEAAAEEPTLSKEALDAVLLAVVGHSSSVRAIADKAHVEFDVAERALAHMKGLGLVNDNVAPGAYFITTDGRDAQDALRPEDEPEATAEAEAPAKPAPGERGDDSPASEADVLGALLEGKPQTIAAIASYLELGVARVAPTVLRLVEARKIERGKMSGRYPTFQKVAS